MKSICLGILLVFFTASTAQNRIPNTGAPDLIIIKSKLGSIVGVDTSRRDPPPKLDDSQQFEGSPPSYEWQAKAELEVQNTGSKTIKSIVWQFPLIVATRIMATSSLKIVQNNLVRSKKEIQPGETVKVTGWIKGAYLKELRKQQKAGLLQGHGEITRINYADGGSWVRSTTQH
jgi:hypothetical protein